jgi:hypothetical protein
MVADDVSRFIVSVCWFVARQAHFTWCFAAASVTTWVMSDPTDIAIRVGKSWFGHGQ